MKPPLPHGNSHRQQAIALDFLAGKDTLAGLAHMHHVPIDLILAWKEDLLHGLRPAQRTSAARAIA